MNLSSTRVYSIVPSTEGHSLGFFPSDPPSPNWKSAEPIATIRKGIVVIIRNAQTYQGSLSELSSSSGGVYSSFSDLGAV